MPFVFVTPPPVKPSEPGLSAAAAAEVSRRLGAEAVSVDASIGWHRFVLDRCRLEARLGALSAAGDRPPGRLLAMRRGLEAVAEARPALRRPETYRSRAVYTTAVGHLEQVLALVASGHPGFRLGLAMVSLDPPERRLESSAVLEELSSVPGPFDDYFLSELLSSLERRRPRAVCVSLTFQQQAPAAFRLARLLAERLPSVERVLGGPLPACWLAAGLDLERAPFTLFDRVVAGEDREVADLVGGRGEPGIIAAGPLAGALDEVPWEDYLAPEPVVPAAIGRGCYWRRCAFCPDHLHPRHRPCPPGALEGWLREVAERFPDGAMLHLTDSAIPPEHLERVATVVRRDRLPLRWHGFVRVEERLAEPAFARLLAEGGCAMLQLGVETGSPSLAEATGKGADPGRAARVLRALGEAGVRSHVYLLFGLPGETDRDRELTLALVEREAPHVHAINPSLLNLPKRSPMHERPDRFGITEVVPFHAETDLSLYDDFRCGRSHPRVEARAWLARRFFRSPAVRAIAGGLRSPFKANHLCFIEPRLPWGGDRAARRREG